MSVPSAGDDVIAMRLAASPVVRDASVAAHRGAASDVPRIPPSVLFVIHQVGSKADGGVQSISELIAHSASLSRKAIVTNAETAATSRWRSSADVQLWKMHEGDLITADDRQRSKLRQIASRIANNVRTWRMVRGRHIDLVHCNDQIAFGNAAFGAKLAGARLVFNVRDTPRPGSRKRALWRMSLRLSDGFMVLSDEMIQAWRAELRPTSHDPAHAIKFSYVHSIVDRTRHFPMDDARRAALRRRLGISAEHPAVVSVGRVEQKKGQLEFLRRSLPHLVRHLPGVVVHFVGDFRPDSDHYAAACAREVDAAGLADHVRFHGYSSSTRDWYCAADVLILTSTREGLPRCVIEGIACGAAIVAFDVCSVREVLVKHDCGAAVSQGDHVGLAEAVAALSRDVDRAARYRARGPIIASSLFDAETNGASFAAALGAIARGARSPN